MVPQKIRGSITSSLEVIEGKIRGIARGREQADVGIGQVHAQEVNHLQVWKTGASAGGVGAHRVINSLETWHPRLQNGLSRHCGNRNEQQSECEPAIRRASRCKLEGKKSGGQTRARIASWNCIGTHIWKSGLAYKPHCNRRNKSEQKRHGHPQIPRHSGHHNKTARSFCRSCSRARRAAREQSIPSPAKFFWADLSTRAATRLRSACPARLRRCKHSC